MDQLLRAAELIKNSKKIVFFGGAGVSTESGIPDFRSADGLYLQNFGRFAPEEILSADFFKKHTEDFFSFYRKHMIYPDAQPNPAHIFLARLENIGKLSAVITQNIDGLHQRAGSRNVLELHGSVHSNHCLRCGKNYPLSLITASSGIPLCPACGGIVKPDVVLYGEPLPEGVFTKAADSVCNCDLLIVGGTSLSVYPAALLINFVRHKNILLFNKTNTSADIAASEAISLPIGQAFGSIAEKLNMPL